MQVFSFYVFHWRIFLEISIHMGWWKLILVMNIDLLLFTPESYIVIHWKYITLCLFFFFFFVTIISCILTFFHQRRICIFLALFFGISFKSLINKKISSDWYYILFYLFLFWGRRDCIGYFWSLNCKIYIYIYKFDIPYIHC